MTSSRDAPFSFSLDLRAALGAPDVLNVAMRFSFPCLFDRDYAPSRAVTLIPGERYTSRLEVRPGATIPARTLVGLFSGHICCGLGVRCTCRISIPPVALGATLLQLAVDGAARSSRFPSAVEAVLYGHSYSAPTVVGFWWHEGPVPCLLAHTARDLCQGDALLWDLDACSAVGYTSSHAEARSWRRAGN
jgi:hypothetical protein